MSEIDFPIVLPNGIEWFSDEALPTPHGPISWLKAEKNGKLYTFGFVWPKENKEVAVAYAVKEFQGHLAKIELEVPKDFRLKVSQPKTLRELKESFERAADNSVLIEYAPGLLKAAEELEAFILRTCPKEVLEPIDKRRK